MCTRGFINLELSFIVPEVQFSSQSAVIKNLHMKIYTTSKIKTTTRKQSSKECTALAYIQRFVLRMIIDDINKFLIWLIPHFVLGFRGE